MDITIDDLTNFDSQPKPDAAKQAAAVVTAATDNPDEVAANRRIAKAYAGLSGGPELSPSMVKQFKPMFEQGINQMLTSTTLSQSPKLADFLKDPDVASMARDDIDNLTFWESSTRNVSNAGSRVSLIGQKMYAEGNAEVFSQRDQDRRKSFTEILADERENLTLNGEQVKNQDGTDAMVGVGPMDVMQALGRYADARYADYFGADDKETTKKYIDDLGAATKKLNETGSSASKQFIDDNAFKEGDTFGQALGRLGSTVLSNPGKAFAWALDTLADSSVPLVGGLATTAITRNPAAGMSVALGGEYAQERYTSAADYFAEKGFDLTKSEDRERLVNSPEVIKDAADRGMVRASIITALDAVSGGLAGRTLVGNKAAEFIVQSAQEMLAGSSGEFLARKAAGQDVSWGEVLAEGLAEMVTLPLDAAIAAREFRGEQKLVQKAAENREVIGQMVDAAMGSKLRERAPDLHSQLVDRALAQQPTENMFISPEKLLEHFQSPDQTAKFMADLGVTPEMIEDAIETGNPIKVKTSAFTEHVVGSEHQDFFADNATFGPDQYSAEEAADRTSRRDEIIAETMDIAAEAQQRGVELDQIEQTVRTEMAKRLTAGGREVSLSEMDAALFGAFYATRAARSGKNLADMVALPKIRGAQPTVGEKSLDQFAGTSAAEKPPGLDEALVMLEDGHDSETIHAETGWSVGADGRLRFEIDDSQAKLKPLQGGVSPSSARGTKLADVYDHETLFKHYPEARVVNVNVEKMEDGTQGYMDLQKNTLAISRDVWREGGKPLQQLIAHEVQHWIQYQEGHQNGTDSRYFEIPGASRAQLAEAVEMHDAIEYYNNDFDKLEAAEREKGREVDPFIYSLANRYTREELFNGAYPEDTYLRTAGEVEARNTETRLDMSAEERASSDPERTSDTMRSSQRVDPNLARSTPYPQTVYDAARRSVELKKKGRSFAQQPTGVTETPEFKAWFGDSKVVDESGKPLVVYHGTGGAATFEAFDKGKTGSRDAGFYGEGLYFTPDEADADSYASNDDGEYGAVMPVYLSLQNPFIWDASSGEAQAKTSSDLAALGIKRNAEDISGSDTDSLSNANERRKFNDAVRAAGYDGVMVTTRSGRLAEVVAFEPNQIKSVNNRGTFDPKDERILYQSGVPMFDRTLPIEGKVTVNAIGQAMDADHQEQFGRQFFPESSEEDYQTVLKFMSDEIDAQIVQPNSGVGWYSKDVQTAIEMASRVYPTLMSEPSHRKLFLTFAGIFSNGMTPEQAFMVSAEAFETFLATGQIPVSREQAARDRGVEPASTTYKDKAGKSVTKPAGWGVRGAANEQQLAFARDIVEKQGSLEAGIDWLMLPQSRSDINEAMTGKGLYKSGRYTTKAEIAGPDALGIMAFGEKLGRYTMGLHGVEIGADDTTVDMWYIRTYRRWTGRLMEGPLDPKTGVVGQPTDTDRQTIFRLTGDIARNYNLPPGDVQAVLWFFEKRLWGAQGLRTEEGTNSSGARKLLEARGLNDRERSYEQGNSSGSQDGSGTENGGTGRYQGGGLAPLAGAPSVPGASGPDLRLVSVAERYAADNGIDLKRQATFVEVDAERATRIAQAYDEMKHDPQDPTVAEAYQNLIQQTLAQYRALEAAGYQLFFLDPKNDIYDGNPWNAMRDLRANQSMGVFPTEAGFGSGATDLDVSDNPLMADTGIEWSFGSVDGPKKRVLANDLFRAVHDAFGHGLEGAGFRARGEENAWQAHIRLFTGSAQGAITSETRGQNSWLNYGPHGEANRNAKVEDTVFADQKTGLMPSWTWEEGRAADAEVRPTEKSDHLFDKFNSLPQAANASISYPAAGFGKGETFINLFATADFSSVAHEGAHFFLLTLQHDAANGDVSAQEEMKAIYEWMSKNAAEVARHANKALPSAGLKAADVIAAFDGADVTNPQIAEAIDTGMQELWARSFERYIREGKAPTVKLQGVFEKFRDWLTKIYRNILEMQQPVDPELRQIFDRLLATDEQLADASEQAGQVARPVMASAAAMGMTDQQYEAFLDLYAQANDNKRAALAEVAMRQLNAKRTAAYRLRWNETQYEVEQELGRSQVYRALKLLRLGKDDLTGEEMDIKLNRKMLEDVYGKELVSSFPGATKDGKGHKNAIFSDNGVDPDLAAGMLGFGSGKELVDAVTSVPSLDDAVEAETKRRMDIEFPDALHTEEMKTAALEAVHNAKAGKVLAAELRAMVEISGEDMGLTEAQAKDAARVALSRMNVKDATTSRRFLASERRAGKLVERLARQVTRSEMWVQAAARAVARTAKAAVKGEVGFDAVNRTIDQYNKRFDTKSTTFDVAEQQRTSKSGKDFTIPAGQRTVTTEGHNDQVARLVKAKRDQLMNHMLYNEAIKLEKQVDKLTDKLWKLGRPDSKLSKGIDIDYVKAARALAGKFGLAKPDSAFDFAAWAKQLGEDDPIRLAALGHVIEVFGEGDKNYQDLSVNDFGVLVDAINSLLAQGKYFRQIEFGDKKVDREKAVEELKAKAASRGVKANEAVNGTLTKAQKRKRWFLDLSAVLIRVESWARTMDDGEQGPFTNYIVRPVMDAVGRYKKDRTARLKQLYAILEPRRADLARGEILATELYDERIDPGQREAFRFTNKGELIHAILHTGNESNLEKFLVGRGWAPADRTARKPVMRKDGKPSISRKTGLPILDKGKIDTSRWDKFVSRMISEGVITKEDFDTAQQIWDLMEGLKRPAQRTHRKVFGFYFKEVEATPIQTPWGEYRGGYVPAIADNDASNDGTLRADQKAMEQQEAGSMFPTTGAGFTKSRVQYNTQLKLDLTLLPSHMDKVLRFTHLEPVVRQTGGLLANRDFRAVMDGVDRATIPTAVVPWLQAVAQQSTERMETIAGMRALMKPLRELRKRVGMTTMFANVINTLQNVPGLLPAMLLVKPGIMRRSTIQYFGNRAAMTSFAMETSEYMKQRLDTADKNLRGRIQDIVKPEGKYQTGKQWAEGHVYFLQEAMQSPLDVITWSAAYEQGIGKGMSHSDAAYEADSVIRRAFSDTGPETASTIERQDAMFKILLMFAGYFNGQLNLLNTQWRVASRTMGGMGAVKAKTGIIMLGLLLPAILGKAIGDAVRGELGDEDDDGWLDDLGGYFLAPVTYTTAMFPGVGQIGNVMIGYFTEQTFDDKLSNPVFSAVGKAAGSVPSVLDFVFSDGKASKAMSDTVYAVGLALGLPAGQLAKTLGYPVRVLEGSDNPETVGDVAQGVMTGRN